MKTVYCWLIIGVIVIGIAHCLVTFKEYKIRSAEAFWFFSAGLALIICGLLNDVNMEMENTYINNVTLIANGLMAGFCVVLAWTIREVAMITVAVVALLLLGVTFYIKINGCF